MNIDLALQREELEGCLHLGMERETLRLAGRILRSQNLNATAFNSAVNALLICEDRLGRWLGRVESAFAAYRRSLGSLLDGCAKARLRRQIACNRCE